MATDNVTFGVVDRRYASGSNAYRVFVLQKPDAVLGAQRTMMQALSSVHYDTYFDGTSIRTVRID